MKPAPAAFLAIYLALRALLFWAPGYAHDIAAYRRWAVTAVQHGIAGVYRESDIDYPPLYAYVLLPLGAVYARLSPGVGTPQGGDHALWTALAKLPPLAFDLALAALLYHVGRRADRVSARPGEGRARAEAGAALRERPALGWRLLLPGAYLANPAVVFDTGYWGHPDSIHSFFVVAAFLLAHSGRAAWSFAALALGTLMKPLAAPFFPLLAALVLWRSGAAALLRGALAAVAAAGVLFLPFWRSGDATFVVRRVVLDLGAMPYTAVNAHNLWGMLGGWRSADTPLLGPLSATGIGLLLFAAAYLAILLRAWRSLGHGRETSVEASGILAAAVGFSFFMLATHMHENHLFVAIPLLTMALPAGASWRRLYVALSLVVLLNLLLHDPQLAGRWPFDLGGPTGTPRPSHGRTYFSFELWAVRAATAFSLAVFATFLYTLWRKALPEVASPEAGRKSGLD